MLTIRDKQLRAIRDAADRRLPRDLTIEIRTRHPEYADALGEDGLPTLVDGVVTFARQERLAALGWLVHLVDLARRHRLDPLELIERPDARTILGWRSMNGRRRLERLELELDRPAAHAGGSES